MRLRLFDIAILLTLLIYSSNICIGQINDSIEKTKVEPSKNCDQKDIIDLIRRKSKPPRTAKRTMIIILPTVSSNPANGLLLGVGSSIGWYLGPRETTRVSFFGLSASVTTKNQFISFLKSSVYTTNNKFFLQGDWRFYIYNALTLGRR